MREKYKCVSVSGQLLISKRNRIPGVLSHFMSDSCFKLESTRFSVILYISRLTFDCVPQKAQKNYAFKMDLYARSRNTELQNFMAYNLSQVSQISYHGTRLLALGSTGSRAHILVNLKKVLKALHYKLTVKKMNRHVNLYNSDIYKSKPKLQRISEVSIKHATGVLQLACDCPPIFLSEPFCIVSLNSKIGMDNILYNIANSII